MTITSTSVTNPTTGAITTITMIDRTHLDYRLIALATVAIILLAIGIYLWRKPLKNK